MSAPTMTRYERYEEISFLRPPGAGYQEEAAMMRRARTEIETGALRRGEQVESVEVWGSETRWPHPYQRRLKNFSTKPMTFYWYRVTITGTES